MKQSMGNRFLFSRYTDGIVSFSEIRKIKLLKNFGLPPERVGKINPALDLKKYKLSEEF